MSFSFGSGPNVRAVGGRSRLLGTAITGLALVFVFGCRATSKPPIDEGPNGSQPHERVLNDSVPPWLGEPLSWQKLETVSAWIDGEGQNATPQWRNEAELVLNTGRLEFARRDLAEANRPRAASKHTTQLATVTARVRSAKQGFDRLVLRDDLNPGQRKRAVDGAERADQLLDPEPAAKSQTSLAVIPRAKWGALKPKTAQMNRTVGGYSRITVHHSADNDPVVLDGSAARSYEAVRDIQRAHMNGKETHYADIGYHFVIDPYGRIIEGRELEYQGAHAMAENNVRNVGICLIGNFDEEKPTEAALTALRRLIDELREEYSIGRDRIYGHRDLRSTRCPGENLERWVISYRGSSPGKAPVQAAAPRPSSRSGR